MNLKTAFVALVLLGASGIASAAPKGEAITAIDLSAVDGSIFYLACHGEGVTDCGIVSIWQEDNKKPGLQKRPSSGAADFGKDRKLTP